MQPDIKPLPKLFYDARGSGYWLALKTGRFLCLDKSNASLHLRAAGVDPDEWIGPLKALERAYWCAQTDRAVDYAGPLAGHRAGVHKTSAGARLLVTSEPNAAVWTKPDAKGKDCPFLEKFLDALLGPEQMPWFLGWLKIACQSLRLGDFRPGQMVALCGPSTCGKSFVHVLVTELLGGRMAKPYLWMTGKTSFNEDIAQAESLVIEDESASTNIGARREFGNRLKQLAVNESLNVHGKGKTAFVAPTFRRITLSVNDEPENLMILPPLDDSILDKIMLFRCSSALKVLSENRRENREKLAIELPAFRALLAQWPLSPKMREPRFGIRAFHNETLLDLLSETAPEKRLMDVIDQIIFAPASKIDRWDGSSEDLEQRLRRSDFSFVIEKLLYFSSACGTYLARLALKFPSRIEARKNKGRTRWIIRAP
jgi:hypothetical protein